jgi:hypothetical protein
MFSRIETAIVKVLQDNLKSVPKDNIRATKPDLNVEKNLPAISLTNVDFDIKEIGIGGSIGANEEGLQDVFSGDGKKREFTLTKKPLRPITKVEHPLGKQKKESDDYTVDYGKGIIAFRSPPEKGRNNILIKYLPPAETKGLKFNLKYHLEIWARDEGQRDAITIEVIKTLLKEGSPLVRQGITIRPIKGFNVPPDEEVPKGVYGKTLEYLIETELQVEIPLPRIERIEVQKA